MACEKCNCRRNELLAVTKIDRRDMWRLVRRIEPILTVKREKGIRESVGNKTPIEVDVERTLTDLLAGKEQAEPIRTGKKIIKTADSETTIEYELAIDPRTGQQQIVEHITTTKKECAICRGHFSQLLRCADCGSQVCTGDSREYSWSGWEDRLGNRFQDLGLATDFKGLKPVSRMKTLCRSCFDSIMTQQKSRSYF